MNIIVFFNGFALIEHPVGILGVWHSFSRELLQETLALTFFAQLYVLLEQDLIC